MRPPFKWLSVLFLVSLTSATVSAACGGGGYSPSKASKPAAHRESSHYEVSYSRDSGKEQREIAEKTDKLQREIDKAQSKLNNCSGTCEKERRKLNEAHEKLASHFNRYGITRRASTSPPAATPTSATATSTTR